MNPLTARQKQVLDIINSFINKGEPFPTLQVIADSLGVRHKSGVIGHLKALEKKGYISRREQRISDFMLTSQEESHSWRFPLTGVLPAGTPGQSFDQTDQDLAFDHSFFGGGNLQAVIISGDSMLGDNICDGDTAIIAMQSDWRERDIVAVRVDCDEVTLKRIQSCPGGKVALIPSNPDYPTRHYPAESVEVIGKFAGLVRKA